MKKVRRFPFARIPAFVAYSIMVAYVIVAFTKGGFGSLFFGMFWYLIGMAIDPKLNSQK